MAPCKALTKEEFTAEKFLPLIRDVEVRQKWPRPFNPDHFFPTVHGMLDSGMLKIWGCESAVLGGLFISNLWSGLSEGLVLFWWARQGVNTEPLRIEFEAEAERRKVTRVSTAIFGGVRSKAMERLYRMKGYEPSEIIYGKFLVGA
jgi:hypothetical protein